MKKFFVAIMAGIAVFAAGAADYSRYYTNMPVELAKVSDVVFPVEQVSVTAYGAKPDGATLCTAAIQTAIDALAAKGGGTVNFPAGVWLTGPIELRSNICLNLDRNAILYFSPDKELYLESDPKAKRVKPCITATRCTNIGITGRGIIDGNGAQWRPVKVDKFAKWELLQVKKLGGVMRDDDNLWYPWDSSYGYKNVAATPEKQEKMRNDLFRVFHCKNILLQGVTIQNSPKFHVHPFNSENVILDGITVRCPWNAQNGDAIDISDCHRVLIVNCTVDCGDDGLCMKSGNAKTGGVNGCEDILIQDNTVFHAHGGFVIGSESICGMKRIVVRDCTFSGTDIGLRFKSAIGRGGKCEDIFISSISMADIKDSAIHFECAYADRPAGSKASAGLIAEDVKFVPEFCDIHISDIVCEIAAVGISASGIEGLNCVYDIDVANSTIIYTSAPDKIDTSTARLNISGVNFIKAGSLR